MTSRFKHRKFVILALTPLLIAVLVFFNVGTKLALVDALELPTRSVSIGTSRASVSTSYYFQFSTASTAVIGSIVLEFCANSPLFALACVPPTGLVTTSAVLTQQTGLTGFSIDAGSTVNKLILTRIAAIAGPTATTYTFGNILNPSVEQSYFVRLSTHSSTDGSGSRVDDGAVVFVINEDIGTSAFVPPFLILCVGVSVAADCSSTSGSLVSLGELSSAQAKSVTTQFAVATNDVLGYVAYISGTTMTSGNNVIPAPTLPTGSSPGTSQFGINLRANSNPPVGLNPSGAGSGVPTTNYNSVNLFKFASGDSIASSTLSTDFNRFTVSYLTNISTTQAPGQYTTTMTYIAVVQF